VNFLAHLYLSGKDEEIKLGNFIGDFVKGKKFMDFSEGVGKGILLHRSIDHYTDTHQTVQQSKKRLGQKYGHYNGVIIDIFYDHFLAKNWGLFSDIELSTFADQCYNLVDKNIHKLPEKVRYLLPFMVKDNWLVNYGQLSGVKRTMRGMAKRALYDSKMDESITDLTTHYEYFEKDFLDFFPDIQKYVASIYPRLRI